MKYPFVSNAIKVVSKTDNEYKLYHCLTEIELVMDKDDYDFMMKLDGVTDPYSLSEDEEYVTDFLAYLESERIIRDGRVLTDSFLALVALWWPKEENWLKKNAPMLNRLLICMSPLCFFLGIYIAVFTAGSDTSFLIWKGIALGLILGVFFHEIGHGIAALAYGGKVFEFGVGIRYCFPMAYTLMDTTRIHSRAKRAQILLAGVEMNFLLAGILLMLTRIHSSFILQMAAFFNVVLAIYNLSGSVMVDGFGIIMELLGVKVIGEVKLKSLLSLPKVSLKGIHKWAFYLSMIIVFFVHLLSIYTFISPWLEGWFL